MGTMLAIGGVIGLILWLAGSASAAEVEPKKEEIKKKVEAESTTPPNGVYPDAGMTLTQAQQILMKLGYDLGPTGADGDYGDVTKCGYTCKALKAYQSKKGLTDHGFLDKATARALELEVPGGATIVPKERYEAGYNEGYNSKGLEPAPESACEGLGAESDYCRGFRTGTESAAAKDAAVDFAAGGPIPRSGFYGSDYYQKHYFMAIDALSGGAVAAGVARVAGLHASHVNSGRAGVIRDRARARRQSL